VETTCATVYEPLSFRRAGGWLLLAFAFVLPIYFQILYKAVPHLVGLPPTLATIVKEGLLVAAAFLLLVGWAGRPSLPAINTANIAIGFFVLYLLLLVPLAPSQATGLFGLRVYTEPLLVYLLVRSVKISVPALRWIFSAFIALGVVLSLWGLFQVVFLGDSFLLNLGYDQQLPGKLTESFYLAWGLFIHRAAATFSSPNVYAFFLHLVLLAAVYLRETAAIKSRLGYYGIWAVLLAGLVYSFSRSYWLALLVSIIIYRLLEGDIWAYFVLLAKGLGVAAVAATIIFTLDFALIQLVREHLWRTLMLEDASSAAHVSSWQTSIAFLLEEPLGIGLGSSGARIPFFGKEVAMLSENSFFTLAFDTGLFGLFLYLLLLAAIGGRLLSLRRASASAAPHLRRLLSATIAILAGQMIAWSFLAYILDLEAVTLLFLLLGAVQGVAEQEVAGGLTGNPATAG